MENMKFNMILAVDEKNWIWKHWSLAWNLSTDMKYFKDVTTKTKDLWKMNAVVMWKNTWNSIPIKYKPLDNRINCVLSYSLSKSNIGSKVDDFVLYFESFEDSLNELKSKENVENIFVIWWANLYNYVLNSKFLDKIYITKIKWDFDCDVFFDWVPKNFVVESYTDWQKENWIEFSFWVYKKTKNNTKKKL
jgi:dihydrofolate reductase